jgi:uncharacterized protein (DUF488 family)
MSGELQVWTVGHSSRKLEEMAEALRAYRISLLVDIRTIPRSRHNPQFNGDTFSRYLQGLGVKYLHMKELGGLRKPRRDSINAAWRNMSFRGFADYMQTREFEEALARLMELLKGDKVAIMCSEGNPYRCHRSLIADALVVRGVRVVQISGRRSSSVHRMTPFARVEGYRITYPAR